MDYSNLSKEQLIEIINNLKKKTKYGINFERKPENVVEQCKKKIPVVKHVPELDILRGGEDHLLIEGDNYHALLALQVTHKEKVDVIYIDPPYNTGNKDFIYNDKFVDQEDGYRHSKWLSFMEPRLKLARNLLKETGVIFISIDDNEMAQLKLLCDQIFGENNFIENIVIQNNPRGRGSCKNIASSHEYALLYSKNLEKCITYRFSLTMSQMKEFNLKDDISNYRLLPFQKSGNDSTPNERPKMNYPIYSDENLNLSLTEKEGFKPIFPKDTKGKDRVWRYGVDSCKIAIKNGELVVKIKKNGNHQLFLKDRIKDGRIPKSIWIDPKYDASSHGTKLLTDMFDERKVFNNPKSLHAIIDCLRIGSSSDATILDFFAGSGTTGHAVLEMNKEDGGNRKFILCTNNENDICKNITHQRIKKVIEGYTDAKGNKIEGTGGNLHYFKTNFISKSKNKDQMVFNLAEAVTDLLAIKEGIFYVEHQTNSFDILSTEDKSKHLCIYYNMMQNEMKDFVKILKSLDGEKIIYMFSLDDYVDEEPFEDIDNATIKPIPKNILEIYNSVLPKDNN